VERFFLAVRMAGDLSFRLRRLASTARMFFLAFAGSLERAGRTRVTLRMRFLPPSISFFFRNKKHAVS
jgi:hypothetical protein